MALCEALLLPAGTNGEPPSSCFTRGSLSSRESVICRSVEISNFHSVKQAKGENVRFGGLVTSFQICGVLRE